uniref:acyl carrier protein n=1 Tax=Gracilaria cearensis TaxID=1574224 RepID=UPI001D0F89FF|nr:acyl carrier protein [Gracilaria cearensis]UAD83787.1 acyl carrier protein [Gracilaria cearensis]
MSEKTSSVLKRVNNVVVEQLGLDIENIDPDASFVTLGADSLEIVELVMAFEEEFGIHIPDADAEDISTIDQAVNYIVSKL